MSITEINDFIYVKEDKYYKLSTSEVEFKYSDGVEEEKYILNCVAEAEDRTSSSDELKLKIRDWSSKYHLSKERANILRAIEFRNKRTIKVLEIGGGCGAITRYLGEEFGEIDTIEGSPYRSKIISERCKDLQNVNVYCANLFEINLLENHYDLIVMIGVLEYSNVYSQIDNDPVKSAQIVLELLKSSINKNGKIILAIENKFGLKYFSGATEDHTGIQFDSIMGYTKPNTPVTYSKKTLQEILIKSGFENQQWFYPYPDYKLPNVFVSESAEIDRSLYVHNWIDTPFLDSGKPYKTLFDERLAIKEIYKSGLLGELSNSFLVVAGKEEKLPEQQWLIKKLNAERHNDFCTEVKLVEKNDEFLVKRKYLFPQRVNHEIENPKYIHNISDESYIKGELLSNLLSPFLINEERQAYLMTYSNKLKNYLEENYSTETYDEDGYLILKPDSVDAIFKNIIVTENNEWVSFDNEWELKNENVTIDYVLFRAMKTFLMSFSHHKFTSTDNHKDAIVFKSLQENFHDFNNERLFQLKSKEEEFQEWVNKGKISITNKHKPNLNDCQEIDFNTQVLNLNEKEEIQKSTKRKIKKRLKSIEYKLGGKRSHVDSELQVDEIYDIVIPIYNAFEHLDRCIKSVLKHTNIKHNIYLLDDASPDKRVLPFLKLFEELNSNVKVIESEINKGFIENVNRGFRLSQNNVIILNSDTEVTKSWLEKHHRCLLSNKRIGIVSPLSNNATILSVPDMNKPNELPVGMKVEEFAELVEHASLRMYPQIPTAIGFCMLITRAVLNSVGEFDTAFGLGYGEENDFCMRARRKSFDIVCADDTYVHHYGSASFMDVEQIDERRLQNQKILSKRWPNYEKEVFEYCRVNPLREIQERIFSAIYKQNKPEILHVIHNFNAPGGTELHTSNIINGVANDFNSTVIYPIAESRLWTDMDSERVSENLRVVKFINDKKNSNEYFLGNSADLENELVESNFAKFLIGGNFETVHFQHLLGWSSLMLPFIAKQLNKKIVLSLHDYYLLCPDYNLILPDGNTRCGKIKADGSDTQCQYCLGAKRYSNNPNNPIAINDYLAERNEVIKQLFDIADVLISPSNFVKKLFVKSFGRTIEKKILVVSHGISEQKPINRKTQRKQLHVAMLGSATDRKGIKTLLETSYVLRKKQIKFEIIGSVPLAIKKKVLEFGINIKGKYKVDDLPKLLSNTDIIIIPSIWDETFALTLSEAQALGVPVVASDVGGISERIIDGETGFLVPPADSLMLSNKLLSLSQNVELLDKVRNNLAHLKIKTMKENIEDYRKLYKTLSKDETPVQEDYNNVKLTINNLNFKNSASIVIPIYNQLKYTKECLESIEKFTMQNYELIFVDNNSTDGTTEWLEEITNVKDNYHLISNDENLGFPKAINNGIKSAKGDFILLLNNDIVVTEGWLERLLEVAESNSKIGIVGPLSNSVSGVQLDPDAKYPSIKEMHNYARKVAQKNKNVFEEFPRVAFLCTLIKKEVIDEIGGLDERFSPGNFEDDDFCLRAQLADYKTVVAKDVFIHHYGSVSFKQNGQDEYDKRIKINEQKFINKWNANPEEIWLDGNKIKLRDIKIPINKDLFIQSIERAFIDIDEEEYDSAIENLKLALTNYDNSERLGYEYITKEELLNIAGNISLTKNQLEDAKDYFEQELNSNPNSSNACFGLGEVFYNAEMIEESKSMYEWAVINNTENQNAKIRLQEVNVKLELPEEHNSILIESEEGVG